MYEHPISVLFLPSAHISFLLPHRWVSLDILQPLSLFSTFVYSLPASSLHSSGSVISAAKDWVVYPEKTCWSPNPWYLWTLFEKRVFIDRIVKEWAFIQYDRHTGRKMIWREYRESVLWWWRESGAFTRQRFQGLPATPGTERKACSIFFPRAFWESMALWYFDLRFRG